MTIPGSPAWTSRLQALLADAPRRMLIGIVQFYRLLLSPWLGSQCRFEPTCSRYALEALQQHGAGHGSYLAARRLLKCHPWCHGGFDPVPGAGPACSPPSASLPPRP